MQLVAFFLRCKRIRFSILGGGMRDVGFDEISWIEDIMGAVGNACCISVVVKFDTLRLYFRATSLNMVEGEMTKEG